MFDPQGAYNYSNYYTNRGQIIRKKVDPRYSNSRAYSREEILKMAELVSNDKRLLRSIIYQRATVKQYVNTATVRMIINPENPTYPNAYTTQKVKVFQTLLNPNPQQPPGVSYPEEENTFMKLYRDGLDKANEFLDVTATFTGRIARMVNEFKDSFYQSEPRPTVRKVNQKVKHIPVVYDKDGNILAEIIQNDNQRTLLGDDINETTSSTHYDIIQTIYDPEPNIVINQTYYGNDIDTMPNTFNDTYTSLDVTYGKEYVINEQTAIDFMPFTITVDGRAFDKFISGYNFPDYDEDYDFFEFYSEPNEDWSLAQGQLNLEIVFIFSYAGWKILI